jgi:hypothetical protein
MRACIRRIGLVCMLAIVSAPRATAQVQSSPEVLPSPGVMPPPEALAPAKELIVMLHLDQQVSAILPGVIKNQKPAIVQGSADVERQYEALAPLILEGVKARMPELFDAAAIIYARNFSIEDLIALKAFYNTPLGQRLLQNLPTVTQETMLAGGKFGQSVGEDMQKRMIEELHKKGVNV